MNLKEEVHQLVMEVQPLVDELDSPATKATCDKLRKYHDKFMELSILMPTGCEHEI